MKQAQQKAQRARLQRQWLIVAEVEGGCVLCGETLLLIPHDYDDASEVACPSCGPLGPFAHVLGQS